MREDSDWSRRRFFEQVSCAAVGLAAGSRAMAQSLPSLSPASPSRSPSRSPSPSSEHGLIRPPLPVPDLQLVRDDGVKTTLLGLVNGRVTALQAMFTTCTATCPIQGAIFARVQKLIPDQVARGIQLLSLSVDPATDTPLALGRWLNRFHRRPGWVAAAPDGADGERVRDLAGRGRSPADNHSTQVQILNRSGQLIWRTAALPSAEEIAAILTRV